MMTGKSEKLDWIIKTCKKQKITAYEIGKQTVLSSFAVSKILSGTTKNPNQSTIDIIENYIREKIAFPDIDNFEAQKELIVSRICEKLTPTLNDISKKIDLILANQK